MSSLDAYITIAGLRAENARLRSDNTKLSQLVYTQYYRICVFEIATLISEVIPGSVYREFLGPHRSKLIAETVNRYIDTIPQGEFDRRCALNVVKKIGAECRSGTLMTVSGEIITFAKG